MRNWSLSQQIAMRHNVKCKILLCPQLNFDSLYGEQVGFIFLKSGPHERFLKVRNIHIAKCKQTIKRIPTRAFPNVCFSSHICAFHSPGVLNLILFMRAPMCAAHVVHRKGSTIHSILSSHILSYVAHHTIYQSLAETLCVDNCKRALHHMTNIM